MKKSLALLFALIVCFAANAQNAEKLYRSGKDLYDAKKYAEAVPKLKAAAEKGHKKAQYRLGRCYDKGHGVTESDAIAFQWYSKSAAQDYAKAQYQLGKSYKNGEGTAKDIKKAFSYFYKSAQQDYAKAQYALGKCYMKGKGVVADQKKATYWLKKSVKNIKNGSEILAKIKQEAAAGDEDAKKILTLIK